MSKPLLLLLSALVVGCAPKCDKLKYYGSDPQQIMIDLMRYGEYASTSASNSAADGCWIITAVRP